MNIKRNPELLSDLLVGNFGTLVNDIFNESSGVTPSFRPAMDLLENEKQYALELSIPGVGKESISVKQEDDLLVISGERKAIGEEGNNHVKEIRRGSFNRRVRLPKNAQLAAIVANYADGILSITIPKKEEAQPRLISVN